MAGEELESFLVFNLETGLMQEGRKLAVAFAGYFVNTGTKRVLIIERGHLAGTGQIECILNFAWVPFPLREKAFQGKNSSINIVNC